MLRLHPSSAAPRRPWPAAVLVALAATVSAAAAPATVPTGAPATVAGGAVAGLFPAATPANVVDVTRRLFPAVVRIDVVKTVDLDGQDKTERGIGSGVIIDPDGRILTNFHVAGRAAELSVTLFDKERVRARLVGDDHWTDLAVIQMDMAEVRAKHVTFATAELGVSRTLVPGQDVMAIGTPFGLARTLTLGTVSNAERTLAVDDELDGYETGQYSNWVQMDVPINPGNSGGPLVDLAGRVVGINTRGGAQNLNFAVPIDTAKAVVSAILASATPRQAGRVDRADLGVTLRPLQDLESYYAGDLNRGVLVDDVSPFGAARAAGLATQDVLLSVNGRPTNVRFPEEMAGVMQQVAALPVGRPATLAVLRDGQPLTLTVTPVVLRSARGDRLTLSGWGLTVREVTPAYARAKQLDAAAGLVVSVVKPNGPAERAGLQPADVVLTVDGRPIADAAALSAAAGGPAGPPAPIILSVRRNRGTRNLLLTPSAAR